MAAGARVKITLRCEECKQRNYNTVFGAQQVLPLLQKAHQARGNQVSFRKDA